MHKVDIKPLSINEAWVGKLRPTKAHTKYKRDLGLLLPARKVSDGYLQVSIVFGFSSASSDIDNPLKPFLDCLQVKYGFNDKMIKRLVVDVEKTKKGKEYIKFEISEMETKQSE